MIFLILSMCAVSGFIVRPPNRSRIGVALNGTGRCESKT